MNTKDTIAAAIIVILVWLLIVNPVSAFVLMLLWNNVLVPLAHVSAIGFWQSLGIVLLLSFVGSFFRSSK